MAAEFQSAKVIVSIETILKNLDRDAKRLDAFRKTLLSLSSIKLTAGKVGSSTGIDKAITATQKLLLQQQRLVVQTQELINRQERARQAADRLAQSQQRLAQSQQRINRSFGQADAHVRFFKSIQNAALDADRHVQFFRDHERNLAKAPQVDAHVRAFRAIQKGADDADAHVRAFRAHESALAKAPQLDAHVQAFRSIEAEAKRASQTLSRLGGTLRDLGSTLTSLGASLTVALTAPLTALGVISTRNAVTLDSLKRGLTAITGSADEAGRQLTRLTELAKLPGIGFQEAIQGSIRLQAVGFSAEVAERALKQFANAVALTGGGREELSRITVQLGQLSAKGKVLAQDLKPIIEAGPAVGRALREAFGTVNSEDIQALGLSSEQFIDKLLGALERLPRAASGAKNSLENFSDAVFRASSAIGDAILPVLTRLIEIAEPIITRLSNAFRQLPSSVQGLVLVFGALAAAAGPALFIFGQLATGVGGVISAFARLSALGLVPTIEGFRLMIPVLRGTTVALTAQQAAAAAAATTWTILAAAITAGVAVLAVAAVAFIAYSESQETAVKVSNEQIAATQAQIDSLKDQLKFIDDLRDGVERTADEQDRLAQIYAELNTQAKVRVTAITDETKRLAQLREELKQLLALRNEERVQQAANLAASLAGTTAQIQTNQKSRDSIAERIKAQTTLSETLKTEGRISRESQKQLEALGNGANTLNEALNGLRVSNENLIDKQGKLIASSKDLNGTAEEQATALRVLQQQTGLSTRELLSAAKSMGVFKGDIEATLPAIEKYIKLQKDAADANTDFQRSLNLAGDNLIKAGDRAEAAAKRRKDLIEAAAAIARDTSVDFKGALKSLKQQVDAVVELRQALQRESEITGKSIEQLITEALSKGQDKGGSQLRNAREQLANQLLQVAEAQKEKELATQKATNEQLLDDNELAFSKQLIAYRQYLEERARLTDEQLAKEHLAQLEIARDARAAQSRLLQAATSERIPETERVKRRTQASTQEEQALKAETKAAEIEAQRARNAADLKRALAEAIIQQVKDIRQLDIEFAELQGHIEDALNTTTIEKFRETLSALGKDQDDIRRKLEIARKAGKTEIVNQLENAQKLNQSQIDLIELITQQELATNKLAAANEFVRRAKERQSDLETQLTFEVEFRGLKEEDAIKRRLEGERKLADSLRVVRDLVQSEIDALNAKGVNPPQALLDFVRETSAAIKGLGELPFSEQFRLAEKEFNRLNDDRLDKIANIERAIRERDIAEAEGLLLIRRINGQYSAELERQVELLKEIATASNDASLQRQAQSAEQTAKDANSQLASFNRQLRSTSIDALQDGFTNFFVSLTDRTKTAKEKLLDLVNSVAERIEQVIAENLSRKLIESLFGNGTEGQGILAAIGRLFGGGGQGAAGGVGGAVASGVTQTADATVAATALTTGATAAATALTTGGVTAGTTLITAMTAAAASFSAAIIAAGAAFAASVAAASAASGISQGLGGLGSGLGAATGIFPAIPGGAIRFVEGGYPEAILTTDPRHAAKQVNILRELIQRTRGFYGRIQLPEFATGGFTFSRADTEASILNSINRAPSISPRLPDAALQAVGGSGDVNLRIINQVESRALTRPYLTSEEGRRDVLNIISTSSNTVRRRIGN